MRTKDEIFKNGIGANQETVDMLILETLLDIRDFLQNPPVEKKRNKMTEEKIKLIHKYNEAVNKPQNDPHSSTSSR